MFLEPPVINEKLTSSDTTVDELKRASLRCVASGHPTPNVTWRRENEAQLSRGHYAGNMVSSSNWEGSFLNFTQVTREDMGAYLCIASNGVQPSVSKRIILQVNCKYLNQFHEFSYFLSTKNKHKTRKKTMKKQTPKISLSYFERDLNDYFHLPRHGHCCVMVVLLGCFFLLFRFFPPFFRRF